MPRLLSHTIAACAAFSLCSCKVETSTEKIPNAEGSGKNAVNIRVAPMSRSEIKDVTERAIDKTADAAGELKDAATTLGANAKEIAARTSDSAVILRRNTPSPEPSAPVIATPAQSVTETQTVTTTTTVPAQ
jgi:hypothetical protein